MSDEILVAGGTGLVGANLTIKLQELGLPVVPTRFKNREMALPNCVQFDFRRFEDCLDATKNKGTVVLCAGHSYGIQKNKKNPTGSILPNLQIVAGLLEASAQNRVKTVVLFSSTTVYQPSFSPLREDQLNMNTPPFLLYTGVGWMNRYFEQMGLLYAATYGMKVIIFRPTSIYGPFDKFDDERSHVIPALIKRSLNKEDPFEVWGSPNVVRDFIYIEDVVDDIVDAIIREDIITGEPFNICNGIPLTIKKAVDAILSVCGHNPEVFFNSDKPSAIPYRTVDDTKYRCYFGDKKRTPFEVGVKKTLEWYENQIKEKHKQP
ncbi:MAG: NAD-dependent epimerase/dehydratase family protein [Desulfobacterales bacterium]|nr:NAD-dependent epimerase/dehydratase family protein [Desulfobacterales bacterium]